MKLIVVVFEVSNKEPEVNKHCEPHGQSAREVAHDESARFNIYAYALVYFFLVAKLVQDDVFLLVF